MGYNFRMTAIKALAICIKYMTKDDVSTTVVPILVKACGDKIPNVAFTTCQKIAENKQYIDKGVFESQIAPKLRELTRTGGDQDVWYHATMCLQD